MTNSVSVDIASCMQQILEDGYCILRGHFPVEAVDACREAFAPISEAYLAEHADNSNRGPNRHYIPLPFLHPLYNPSFFDDDTVFAITSGILGEDMVIDQFASDTPFKGSVHQEIHSDLGLLFAEEANLCHPPALLAMNWPFVDVTPERGPFQIGEGTHLIPREDALARINSGEIPLKSLPMQVGDVLIRDARCLHRGSPNQTDTPRVVAVVSFLRAWYYRERRDTYPLPRSIWEGLSDREKRLMRRLVIDELH